MMMHRCHTRCRARAGLLAGLFLASCGLGPDRSFTLGATLAQAQQPPMSAGHLRRLAEVADAYRTGRPVFIVGSTKAPYDVVGVFEDTLAARTAVGKRGDPYRVFGPYVTPRDPFPAPPAEVLSITVRMRTRGDTVTLTVDPREYDAMFWTLASVDKFLVPYNVQVYGLRRAIQLREEYLQKGSRSVVALHMGHTIGTMLLPPP